ncbi:hypothetical protein [Enteractinococcus coprophilus]|uniref:Uncharacterized protein n=1 Tax=Enteractinococcus coprophilus TaxID=1027633 RepID=A0A543AP22_9MICC|nr:hypothetical protein [Enteractinococcus coprophilus]TQL74296.1 hypothetical protein FB556_0756 [Enteractinococcus coprophilus]
MSRVGRLVRGTGIFIIAALGLSGCGGTSFDQSAATKVIQSVDVNLDPAGAITEVASNAVYLDELSGRSNNSTDDYTVEEVVEDLPVRVSTQYTTDEGSGSNLEDLEGHTGRVEIAVTVENLTLNSSDLTYDVAGESRQSSALVGTPLSVAGSVELKDTTASSVVVDVESDNTTNGVVSQTTDGDAVVQWGTVLAPPQSEATTTFRLVADVEDFSTPEFDLAVQAGFHTDMSFEGMLTSAFDTSAGSEYAMQQKAIELVAEINEVLTRAGTTITEIRQNLDHTSETLGVDAAQQLRQNSDDMVTEMQRVGEQLTALEAQVDGSLSGAETAMNSQLAEIVSSMSGMMGNTEATAPKLVTGQGCAATVEDAESNGSLYSTFLILGAQLEGYANANAECRDEIVSGIQDTLGPEIPDAEVCKENSTSITCALFAAQDSVLSSLGDLVGAADEIVGKLQPEKVEKANRHNEKIGKRLERIDKGLQKILDSEKTGGTNKPGNPDNLDVTEPEVTWDSVSRDIEHAREELASIGDVLPSHSVAALEGVDQHNEEIGKHFERIDGEANSIAGDYSDLAEEVCESFSPTEDASADPRNKISFQLTGTDCDDQNPAGTDKPGESMTSDIAALVGESYKTELEKFRADQEAHWNNAAQDLDVVVEGTAAYEIDAALQDIDTALTELEGIVGEDIQSLNDDIQALIGDIEELKDAASDEAERVEKLVGKIEKARKSAAKHQSKLEEALEVLATYENDLPEEITEAFQEVVDDAASEFPERVNEQIRIVTDRINNAEEAVTESYNTTISGLATTSDAVVNDTANQLDQQKKSLEEQRGATTEALNKSTTNVLESIHASTTSSTRDLQGASAQLGASLSNVILDLGDPEIQGSGILGSMSASSAMSNTADYQLALASQRAAGYANVRSEDIAEIMLRQAQFSASLEAAGTLPAFHLDVPNGARTQTIYAFHIGGDSK